MRIQRLPTKRKRSMVLARPDRRVEVLLAWPLLMMQASRPPVQAAEIKAARNSLEQKTWNLLDDGQSVYVTLSESDFRALGAGFDLPDGGKAVTALAMEAPGGAFDSRDVDKIPSAKWVTRPTGSRSASGVTTWTGILTRCGCAVPARNGSGATGCRSRWNFPEGSRSKFAPRRWQTILTSRG